MIPEKKPTPSLYAHENDPQTEQEWQEYFELRKIYDKSMDEDSKLKLLDALDAIGYKDSRFVKWGKLYPLPPILAYRMKHIAGLKRVQAFNLYEAKAAYPEEF